MDDFSQIVFDARTREKLTVEQLAVSAGVSSSTVRAIERGDVVRTTGLDKVLARLGYRLGAVKAARK